MKHSTVEGQEIPLILKGYPPLKITAFEYERARPREGLRASSSLITLQAQNERTGRWEVLSPVLTRNVEKVHWKEVHQAIERAREQKARELPLFNWQEGGKGNGVW